MPEALMTLLGDDRGDGDAGHARDLAHADRRGLAGHARSSKILCGGEALPGISPTRS